MRNIPNREIRIAMLGFKNYEVAEAMGITEFTLCRLLRRELPPEKKTLILSAIERLSAEGRCKNE